MATQQLFEKNESYNGFYAMLLVNRFQMLYFFLIMPGILIYPHMIWVIIALGGLSQLNLLFISKWLLSPVSREGYSGFVRLFGKGLVRLLTFIGLFFLFLKLSVITLGYSEIIQTFILPTTDTNFIILFILLFSFYVAGKGMEPTIRFVVISFLCSFWIIILFVFFFLPPIAQLSDLYPLIPLEWKSDSWKAVFLIMSSYSGPELLLFLGPWLKADNKTFRYLSYGNAYTVIEYVFLFIASLLYFGSTYLSKSRYPIVDMARYFQNPVFERTDMILLSFELFNIVFAVSLFLLLFYGASKIVLSKMKKPSSGKGLLFSVILIYIGMVIVNELFWKSWETQIFLLHIQIIAGCITYFLLPLVIVIMMKKRGGNKYAPT
ncbi:GerAB/ArcD/ProY family transporter [Paenalkalicoccus suaedae]|uniref:GerAB/ArcD/ProY family transporter n=1 Tax=Paenalkalicoccus suaedae TaxID=2592382 RepID=A0A859FBY2_9BACI|nr:GerAB/ArcD/ProY family transporter [Paenalkalicoccus suaedae]QKS70282.1 GerAB/ArcD/ProY family transporter [Paenalkalicoccus suaedae]